MELGLQVGRGIEHQGVVNGIVYLLSKSIDDESDHHLYFTDCCIFQLACLAKTLGLMRRLK